MLMSRVVSKKNSGVDQLPSDQMGSSKRGNPSEPVWRT